MPLQDHMKLISVDDHIIEPPHLWSSRLPKKYDDVLPRIVQVDSNVAGVFGNVASGPQEAWSYEGELYTDVALNAVAGMPRENYSIEPMRLADVRPGCYDPVARLADMDESGVWAQLCFATFPRFAGVRFAQGKDKDLSLLCIQAYNDFLFEEWCAADPARFIPMILTPLWDARLAAKEIERNAARGARAIAFPENPAPLGMPSYQSDFWDPLFAAAQAANMPLCLHMGTSGFNPAPSKDSSFATSIALFGCNSMAATMDIIFSPTLHKFPDLKFALSEGGIGWIPYMIERADSTWERHRYYTDVNLSIRPSELFARNIWGCYIDDVHGLESRHLIGIDKIMWESDYPHSDSHWPHDRENLAKHMADVPDEDVHKIVELNARKLFNWYPEQSAGAR